MKKSLLQSKANKYVTDFGYCNVALTPEEIKAVDKLDLKTSMGLQEIIDLVVSKRKVEEAK